VWASVRFLERSRPVLFWLIRLLSGDWRIWPWGILTAVQAAIAAKMLQLKI
jgi:hypothetical protein